ncbi:hypothetical protein HOLleu_15180 [Holothuria leucospilota]|uniref:Uncharacterized protein n=1 Tax=Holothuria leucospilota TaxID=206669 RepID=A0A9Q1H9G2_HOLLE|nr:hypothetical protein HOLleu_15180 [Holothuria leucospilota]
MFWESHFEDPIQLESARTSSEFQKQKVVVGYCFASLGNSVAFVDLDILASTAKKNAPTVHTGQDVHKPVTGTATAERGSKPND